MDHRHYTVLSGLLLALVFSFQLSAQTTNVRKDALIKAMPQAHSDTERVILLIKLARVIDCKDAGKKIATINEAKELAEKIDWTKGLLIANRNIGETYFECLHDTAKAFECFERNVTYATQKKDRVNEAQAIQTIGEYWEQIGDHKQALVSFGKALQLRPGIDMEMGIYGEMGFTYSLTGDHINALLCYIRSLELLDISIREKKNNDPQDIRQRAALLLNIGDIYQSISQPGKALENYNIALGIGRQTNDEGITFLGLMGIGRAYKTNKEYDKAIQAYMEALKTTTDTSHFNDRSKIMNELASVYLEKDEPAEALPYAKDALQQAIHGHDPNLVARCYTTLGKIYLAQSIYTSAIPSLEKALSIYQGRGELDDEKDTWEALSIAYEKTGQPARSLETYRRFISLRDSVYNITKANELTRIDLEFRYNRKQLADSLKQAAIYGKKMERQRILTYSGYIGLVLVLLLAFFVYRNYQTQKKYNYLLSKEQKRHLEHIEAQSNTLTDIAHIQSHKVRGPVATILGLAQLFNHSDATDPINKEVMEGISTITEELDIAVKEVITKQNKLRKVKK